MSANTVSGNTVSANTVSGNTVSATAGRILVVDDEPMVGEVLCAYLEHEQFHTLYASTGPEALEVLATQSFDLVVLDVMLPGLSGFAVLEQIRAEHSTPVVMLSALGEEKDRIVGLEAGADDYIAKPFSPREVTARVRSVLRRSRSVAPSGPVRFGDIVVDTELMVVTVGGDEVALTRREFQLLDFFIAHTGEVLSREEILNGVWGSSQKWQDPSTVTVHVARLRQKLEPATDSPVYLLTVFGVGYRFQSS